MGPDSRSLKYISMVMLAAVGGILATPLAAGPGVLLALIATVTMLAMGRGTLNNLGNLTIEGRNVLLIAFGFWFLAELISTSINNRHWQNLDYPLRFMLGIGAFWIVRYTAIRHKDVFIYSIVASSVAAAALGIYQHFEMGIPRIQGWTNNPIYFGNLSLLLCVYAGSVMVATFKSMTVRNRAMLGLACVLLVVAAFLSGARSSWLGMLALLVLIDWRRVSYVRLLAGALLVSAAVGALLALLPELLLNLRITEAATDLQRIWNGDYTGSIGLRLQLWKAALLMFWSSPLIGIGSNEFQAAMANLVASGAIESGLFQGETSFNQAHSEMMDILASKGLVGLAAYAVMLVLPFRFFSKILKSSVPEARAFALMGQATIVAFLMFGLTLATFKVQIYCAVFPVTIAVFAAMALNFAESGKQQEKTNG